MAEDGSRLNQYDLLGQTVDSGIVQSSTGKLHLIILEMMKGKIKENSDSLNDRKVRKGVNSGPPVLYLPFSISGFP